MNSMKNAMNNALATALKICLLALLSRTTMATAQDATAPATNLQVVAAPGTNNAEADKAWRETYKATQSPLPPKEWEDKKPSTQEVIDFYDAALVKGADKARDFYTRYPDHPKAGDARKAEYNMISLDFQRFGDNNQIALLEELQ